MKKVFISILLIMMLFGCSKKEKNNTEIEMKESEFMSTINVIINNQNFILNLDNNETVNEFVKILPKEFEMTELNGNEKYIYLDSKFKTNSYNPKKINKGDVMLYGNNCLVLFYKSFDTSYSYTKIGHIDNLPDLGKENIVVRFEK